MRPVTDKKLAIAWKNEGFSYTEIGQRLNITRHSAANLCQYKNKKMPNKRGPKFSINKAETLRITRAIANLKDKNERVNSTKLKNECELHISRWTIQRHMRRHGFQYKNMRSKIYLSKKHKDIRLQLIRGWITKNHPWEKTAFSDEKRFSLDGPDDWRTYATKYEESNRQQRQCRGGSVMIWLMCLPNGLLSYKFISGKFKADAFIELMQMSVVPILKLNFGNDFWLQQDNASVHNCVKARDFMMKSSINILQWPARSPDLNIVEDIWKLISDQVYDDPQFRNTNQLMEKIKYVINLINQHKREKILDLYKSIRGRLCTVLYKKGALCNK